jgi:hypothetical protein
VPRIALTPANFDSFRARTRELAGFYRGFSSEQAAFHDQITLRHPRVEDRIPPLSYLPGYGAGVCAVLDRRNRTPVSQAEQHWLVDSYGCYRHLLRGKEYLLAAEFAPDRDIEQTWSARELYLASLHVDGPQMEGIVPEGPMRSVNGHCGQYDPVPDVFFNGAPGWPRELDKTLIDRLRADGRYRPLR